MVKIGPKAAEGQERISQSNLRHGTFTKDERLANAAVVKAIRKELR